jgi:hypothetical protein
MNRCQFPTQIITFGDANSLPILDKRPSIAAKVALLEPLFVPLVVNFEPNVDGAEG